MVKPNQYGRRSRRRNGERFREVQVRRDDSTMSDASAWLRILLAAVVGLDRVDLLEDSAVAADQARPDVIGAA
jgi:hypothetical protein